MTTLNEIIHEIIGVDPEVTISLGDSEERWEPVQFMEEMKDQKGNFRQFGERIYKDPIDRSPPFAWIHTRRPL